MLYGNCYDKNETMKLLGQQFISSICGEEYHRTIKDIAEARPNSFDGEVAADIYMLGYIHGKRAERARRK